MRTAALLIFVSIYFSAAPAVADVLTCQKSDHPFARGQCGVLHSSDPEGWLRGSVSLIRETGQVDLQFQIETDSIASAPKGNMTVELRNKNGLKLATITMGKDATRGGKSCGKAVECGITTFPLQLAVPVNVAREVTSIIISLQQTGKTFAPLNLPIGELSKSLSVKYSVQLASLDMAGQPSIKTISTPLPEFDKKARIVGGEKVDDGKYPWMAALYKKKDGEWFQVCGGSLIDKHWVLTASHCHVDKDWLVVIGRTDLATSKSGRTFHIKQVVPHPKYNEDNYNNDLALIMLDTASDLPTIDIVTSNPKPDSPMVVAGWGAQYEGGATTVALRHVKVNCIKDSDCASSYPGQISDNMFCAGKLDGEGDSCQGDSGGPLFFSSDNDTTKFLQAGVVSWGEGCARRNRPGVYTRLTKYNDWIAATIRP